MTPERAVSMLNTLYGPNAATIQAAIVKEFAEYQENRIYRRNYFSAATMLAGYCKSFLQAQKHVSGWAGIPFES